MKSPLRVKLAALIVAFASTLAPGIAQAQMIPLQDFRVITADVTFLGIIDNDLDQPPAPFAYFESTVGAYVEHPDPEVGSYCESTAFQVSQFFPGGISMSGTTAGGFYDIPGTHSALSDAYFSFRVDTCIEYQLDAWLLPGDVGNSRIDVSVPNTNLAYQDIQAGELHTTGRLPAGEYRLEGTSAYASDLQFVEGPTYSVIWTCLPCITTLIWTPPQDQTVACGGTAVFSVVPTGPLAGLTYQWRRNLVPLTDNGHVSGATTQTLTINNACDADAGHYDVVLSDGTILEPSQLARLTMTTVTAVEVLAEGPARPFSIQAAGPNPFSGSMSFRYAAAVPQHVTITIYNASGARVRSLKQGVVSGSGTVTWDGDTDAGTRAPAGIYFLRAEAGSIRESRKIVLVR